MGYVANSNPHCAAEAPVYITEVDAAIDRLIREHGELFENGPYGIRFRSHGAYVTGVIDNLTAAGFCAGYDGEELQIKESNDSNEQYDISSAGGYVRRGSYLTTCRPAAFPTPEPPLPPPPAGCALPSSREITCGSETAHFLGDVEAAIDQVYSEHREYFDFEEAKGGCGNCYKIRNVEGYLSAMTAAVAQRGYCARYDGEELVVKRTNEFSDHYDILTSDDFVRRGQGSYSVSCYPAAF